MEIQEELDLGVQYKGSANVKIDHCRVCGKRLTTPESIRDGIGPQCKEWYNSSVKMLKNISEELSGDLNMLHVCGPQSKSRIEEIVNRAKSKIDCMPDRSNKRQHRIISAEKSCEAARRFYLKSCHGRSKFFRCISLAAPVANLICPTFSMVQNNLCMPYLGRKSLHYHRGLVLIHASAWCTKISDRTIQSALNLIGNREINYGIIGLAELIDINSCSSTIPEGSVYSDMWAGSKFIWVFENFVRFNKPVEFHGRNGLFNVPFETVRESINNSMQSLLLPSRVNEEIRKLMNEESGE